MKINGHYSRSISVQNSHTKHVCRAKSKQDIKTSRLSLALHKQQAAEKSRWESKKSSIDFRNAGGLNNEMPLQVVVLMLNLARPVVSQPLNGSV
jgi:hypothetical protein